MIKDVVIHYWTFTNTPSEEGYRSLILLELPDFGYVTHCTENEGSPNNRWRCVSLRPSHGEVTESLAGYDLKRFLAVTPIQLWSLMEVKTRFALLAALSEQPGSPHRKLSDLDCLFKSAHVGRNNGGVIRGGRSFQLAAFAWGRGR